MEKSARDKYLEHIESEVRWKENYRKLNMFKILFGEKDKSVRKKK